jgi:hypothetical protein
MHAGVKIRSKPEEQIADPGARRFYSLGMHALSSGDPKGAVLNLRMALSLERNEVIREALGRAEAQGRSGSGGSPPAKTELKGKR